MSRPVRTTITTLLAAACALAVPAAAHAAFGVSVWEAGTCYGVTPSCTYASVEKNHAEAFTQAAGHPPWGITTFQLNSKETLPAIREPEGAPLKRLRVDVAAGVASDPQAPLSLTAPHEKCSISAFEENKCPPGTEVGTNEAIVFSGASDVELVGPLAGHVYNLEPQPGAPIPGTEGHFQPIPLLFGIQIATEHSFLEGHVSWAREPALEARGIPSGDYHEWFEINNLSKSTPVLKSKLNFNGRAGGNFITLPSECGSTSTSYIEVESWSGEVATKVTHTPLGVDGCAQVPFAPSAEVTPENAQSDEPDGVSTQVKVPQKAGPEEINTADIRDAHVTFPEGLTLNSAAARGLTTCSPAQIGIGTANAVSCPPASKIGEVLIEADLPERSLTGNVYLGAPEGEPITGPPYTIYVDAESATYGVSVRLQGKVTPDPVTGRLETAFLQNPQQPFSSFVLKLKGGPQAPVANPLTCSPGQLEAAFAPYTGLAAALAASPFAASGCPSSPPFALAQSTQDSPASAAANASYTFDLARESGQQYLASIKTVLPPGLVGVIPSVTLCGEPQAEAGSCPAASQIGTASVTAGAGSEPYPFEGPVYLTGPYAGAPYGLSIPIRASAGPFDLGTVVTRAAIGVDPYSARVVTTTSPLRTIVGGVPLRLRSISVAVNRPGFLLNPTSCAALSTDSTLGSTLGALQNVSSPFQVTGCGGLSFAPSFRVSTNAKTSKADGASLQVELVQGPGQANIRSVLTQLPLQLPSRLTTLQKACPEATFAANPLSCPAGSDVGSASAVTPVLPGTLSGPAYLVSHGGAAFPDLDIVLEDAGVRVILVGNTDIKGGVTSSTFASVPDVPVSSFRLTLPSGPHSALAAYGSLCAKPLIMPTTITAQNGAVVRQSTRIAVAGCGIRIVRRRILHRTLLLLTIQTFAPGRVLVSGRDLRSASKRFSRALTTTLRLPLSRRGGAALRHRRALKLRVGVRFIPANRGEARSSAATTVTFRR